MAEAALAYRKALVIDPDLVPAIVNLANLHYARDELIEAQALYERAIGLDPDCFEAHFNLGNILHDLGRFEGALVCYRDAVALNPGYADAHFYLAVTLEKTGHSPEAKPHWKTYQELAPNGEWVELARSFGVRGGSKAGPTKTQSRPSLSRRLVREVDALALLRRAAELVERALRAPGVGAEPFLAGKRQHVAVGAELARRRASRASGTI